MRGRFGFFLDIRELAEDADHAVAAVKADRADLDRHAIAVLVDQDDRAVDVFLAHHVLRERLAGPPCFLGGDNGCDLAATNVSHEA